MPKKGEKMSAEQKAKIAEKRKKKADLIKMHTRMYPIHLARISALEKEVDELKKKFRRKSMRVESLGESYHNMTRRLASLKTKHLKLKKEIIKRYGALPNDPIHGAHRRIGEKINDITDEVRRQKARGVIISKRINRRAGRPDVDETPADRGHRMGHDGPWREFARDERRAIWLNPQDRKEEGLHQYDELDQQLRVRQRKTMVSNYMVGKTIKPASSGFVPKVAAGALIAGPKPTSVRVTQDAYEREFRGEDSFGRPILHFDNPLLYRNERFASAHLRHEDYRFDTHFQEHFHGGRAYGERKS